MNNLIIQRIKENLQEALEKALKEYDWDKVLDKAIKEYVNRE